MAIERMITCDGCGVEAKEPTPNQGWPGWSAIQGVVLNDVPNPGFCPVCTGKIMEFVDKEVK